MTERGQLVLPFLTAADRLAFFHINARRPQAFVLTHTPQGTRLEAGPYVGVFGLASFTLQVKPKAEIGTRNLLLMLARIQGRRWTLPPASLTLDHTDLQEELAALFVATLHAEVQRGLLRRSQTVREDLPVLRGRLRVADYLRRSDPTKLPVEYVRGHPALLGAPEQPVQRAQQCLPDRHHEHGRSFGHPDGRGPPAALYLYRGAAQA